MNYENGEQILILALKTILEILTNIRKIRAIVKKKAKKISEQII